MEKPLVFMKLRCRLLFPVVLLLPFACFAGEAPASGSDAGLTFPISYIGEGLGNLSGGYRRGAVCEGLLNVGVQGDLEKLAGWKGGSFLVNGLYPHGPSLTDNYVHDFNFVSNIDTYDSLRLYEAWFQQELGDFSIRGGQLLADAEFFISSNGAHFINSAFGVIPLISQNFSAPVFPIAAPGVRVRWKGGEAVVVQAAVYDGDVGDCALTNRHGVEWTLNGKGGALGLAEIDLTPWKEGGTYKVGAFYHSPSENDDDPGKGYRFNAGGYFIADQPLWRKPGGKDQGFNAFVRISGAPSARSTVPIYFDAGLICKGLLFGRDEDIAGVGISCTHISSALRDEAGEPLEAHHEAILEVTYKIKVNETLTVQPDVQYIFNPGAMETQDNAVVAGVRMTLNF